MGQGAAHCGACGSPQAEAEVVVPERSQAKPEEDEPSDAGTASTTASVPEPRDSKGFKVGSDSWLMRRQMSSEAIGFNKAGYNREPIQVVLEKKRKDDDYGMICSQAWCPKTQRTACMIDRVVEGSLLAEYNATCAPGNVVGPGSLIDCLNGHRGFHLTKEQFKKARLELLIVPAKDATSTSAEAGDRSEAPPQRGSVGKSQVPLYSNNCPVVKEGEDERYCDDEDAYPEEEERTTTGLVRAVSGLLKRHSKEKPLKDGDKKASGRFDKFGRPIPVDDRKSSGRFDKYGRPIPLGADKKCSAQFDKFGRPIARHSK